MWRLDAVASGYRHLKQKKRTGSNDARSIRSMDQIDSKLAVVSAGTPINTASLTVAAEPAPSES